VIESACCWLMATKKPHSYTECGIFIKKFRTLVYLAFLLRLRWSINTIMNMWHANQKVALIGIAVKHA
jgi:hypothetical protein